MSSQLKQIKSFIRVTTSGTYACELWVRYSLKPDDSDYPGWEHRLGDIKYFKTVAGVVKHLKKQSECYQCHLPDIDIWTKVMEREELQNQKVFTCLLAKDAEENPDRMIPLTEKRLAKAKRLVEEIPSKH